MHFRIYRSKGTCPSRQSRCLLHSIHSSTDQPSCDYNESIKQEKDDPCGSSRPIHLATRRSLLLSSSAASLSLSLPAHALKTIELRDGTKAEVFEHGMSLSIVALRGSVPSQWILDYRATLGKYAGFGLGQRQQIRDIFEELAEPPGSRTKQSAALADVVTLGDSWLGPAIRRGLVQPLPNAEHSRWFQSLGPRWQALVRRDPTTGLVSSMGQVFAAPYRWNAGALVAYRSDRLNRAKARPITDWVDLLQPQFKGKIAFPSSSRVIFAIALMTLGLSPNATYSQINKLTSSSSSSPSSSSSSSSDTVLKGCEVLKHRVMELRGQALMFSDRDHIRSFTAGDAWVLVGSSQDLIATTERMSASNTSLIAPKSGCLLTADLWVVPSGAGSREGSKGLAPGPLEPSSGSGPSPLLPSWLEFGSSPYRTSQHSGLKTGAAPSLLPLPPHPHPHRRKAAYSSSEHLIKIDPVDNKGITATSAGGEGEREGEGEIGILSSSNNYLPSQSTLLKSEFLLPLDLDARDCFKMCF